MSLSLPDAATLGEQLEQARATRTHLDDVIAWLEQGVELLGGPVPAPPTIKEPRTGLPAPSPPKPARATARDIEAKVVSAVISANQPLSRAQIVERTGLTVPAIKNPLQRLVAAGKIHAQGATINRRYSAGDAPPPHTAKRAEVEKGTARIAAQEKAAVMRIGERDRVMKAIAADSGKLNDSRLADALGMDVDDVADACDALLANHAIRRDGNGTYWRNTNGRAAVAA